MNDFAGSAVAHAVGGAFANPLEPMLVTGQVLRLYEPHAISMAELLGMDANHELAEAIWSHSMEGVVVSTDDGAIIHYNAVAERAFGYKPEEVLGLTLPKLFPKPVLDDFLGCGASVYEVDKVQGVRRNGTAVPLRLKFTRLSVGGRELWAIYLRDVSEVDRQRQEIERLAHIDTLTQLPNRNLLNDRLQMALSSSRRYRRNFALLYVDLDKFKPVNDQYGHSAGDRVLRELARRLRDCVRDTDTVARVGGDEFVALLTDLRHTDDVRIVAERILATCAKPVELTTPSGRLSLQLGASVGVAVFPTDGDNVETLQKCADVAMYHAKATGRNRYAFFTSDLNSVAEQKSMIERGLQRALADGGLMLHYQPQIDLVTGRLVGAEALMRWNDNGSMIQPGEFIPVAEETGLIVPMGEWALREACRMGQSWRNMGLGDGIGVRIGVNLSVRQFNDGLPDLVFGILEETGLPASLLDLEITESFMASDHRATDILRRLRDGGVHLSVDDFGTGYSCLQYLTGLPLNTIKVDRSFVNGLTGEDSQKSHAVVETIITLAQKLGMTTLAEGIESEEQAVVLREMGCNVCQGYRYSRPLPAEEFVRFAQGC